MRDTAFVFFLAAVTCVTFGMAWGIQMGITQQFVMAPAHAHLNLVGWVTLALFAVYYRLTPQAAGLLAKIHAAVAISGVALMVGGMIIMFSGGTETVTILGSLVTAASMLIFLVTVLRHGFGAGSTSSASSRTPSGITA